MKNANKLDEKVCNNIQDKNEQQACKGFFRSRANPQQLNPWK